jgi:opacity protein-like surface antigen
MTFLKYTVATAALVLLFASPAMAQSTDTPAPAAQGAAQSGQTSGTDAQAQVPDTDVFGYDITQGAANLTPEQLTAAKNTCNQNVTAEPLRYSSAVKAFCTSLQ